MNCANCGGEIDIGDYRIRISGDIVVCSEKCLKEYKLKKRR